MKTQPEATPRLKEDPIEKFTARYAGKYDAEFLQAIDKALAVNESKRPQTIVEWNETFGSDDRLPLDSHETRLLPRKQQATGRTPQALLQSPQAIMIGAGAAVVLLLGTLWLISRPKPHGDASHVVAVQPTAQGEIVDVSPAAPFDFQLDPRLVGTWETKGRWQPNSARTQTARWTVQDDANFTFSGPWSDAGAIAAADGKMMWFSNNSTEPVDIAYEFDGDTLVTHGLLGDAQWTRTRRSSQHSNRSTQQHRQRGHTDSGDSIKREIFRRLFDRIRR